MPDDPTLATINFNVEIEGADIVEALNNNDELVLAFITEMLEKAGSSELRDRLASRLVTWEDDQHE